MKALDEKIAQLRDQTWAVAKESLDNGEKVVYRSLTDIAEKLTKLIGVSDKGSESINQKSQLLNIVAIYKIYKGHKYEAQLDTERIDGGRRPCVLLEGKWWTASGSANHYATGQTNGWRQFWRYNKDGVSTPIEELKRQNREKK